MVVNIKKAKGAKKCVQTEKLSFKIIKKYLLNNKIILTSQQSFKREYHNVYT